MGWWRSSLWTEATGTLDSVPLILDATSPFNNNRLVPCVTPLWESARALPPPFPAHTLYLLLWPLLRLCLLLISTTTISDGDQQAPACPPSQLTSDQCIAAPDFLPDVLVIENLPHPTCADGSIGEWRWVVGILVGDGDPPYDLGVSCQLSFFSPSMSVFSPPPSLSLSPYNLTCPDTLPTNRSFFCG